MTIISDSQLEANRQNSLKGGVKTDEGKSIVRFNARTHGILANLVAEYEAGFYQGYVEQLFEEFQPKTFIENILVERIALHYLKLYRLSKAEGEFVNASLHTSNNFTDSLFKSIEKGGVPLLKAQNVQHIVDIYQRYEIAIENRLYRAIRELKEYR